MCSQTSEVLAGPSISGVPQSLKGAGEMSLSWPSAAAGTNLGRVT